MKISDVKSGTQVKYLGSLYTVTNKRPDSGAATDRIYISAPTSGAWLLPDTKIEVVTDRTKFEIVDLEYGTVINYQGHQWTLVEDANPCPNHVLGVCGKAKTWIPENEKVTLAL